MQVFLRLPEPYYKYVTLEVKDSLTYDELINIINSQTIYKNVSYYLTYGSFIIDRFSFKNLKSFNEKPKYKITNGSSIQLYIRYFANKSKF